MTKYFCDKCKKETKFDELIMVDIFKKCKSFYICENCYKKILKWLNKR